MPYDAFISYSHSSDSKLAPALQRAFKSLAKPWYRRRALSVFRDATNLSAAADLTAAISDALAESRFFVYLASPTSAKSPWVGEEIMAWRSRNLPENLFIALTDGEIVWDSTEQDFDWEASTALHPNLKGIFSKEPLWVDLRWVQGEKMLSPRDPRFQHATAMLAAPMHGRTLDELIGEDVIQSRRTHRWIASVIVTLTLLLGLFVTATLVASRTNANLHSKLTLLETTFPFFNVAGGDTSSEESHKSSSVAANFMKNIGMELFYESKIETWVDWGPDRLALSSDCIVAKTDPVYIEAYRDVNCPTSDSEFDPDGLRADIPGLRFMLNALIDAIQSGRAADILAGMRGLESEIDYRSPYTEEQRDPEDDIRALVDRSEILLPDGMWQRLPHALRGSERTAHFEEFRGRYFELWRYPIQQTDIDAEIILLRINDTGFCGSAGCTDIPVVGFYRLGTVYELVFAQLAWGTLALYESGPGKMPQIFIIETQQSGAMKQFRSTTRTIFDNECNCYKPYLRGQIVSMELNMDQLVPDSIGSPGKQE